MEGCRNLPAGYGGVGYVLEGTVGGRRKEGGVYGIEEEGIETFEYEVHGCGKRPM